MNKKNFIVTVLISTMLLSNNVFAYNYNFGQTYNLDAFGKATTSEVAPDNSAIQNIRRDKNVALLPPTYGIFSGEFDTNPTNPYFTPTPLANTTEISGGYYNNTTETGEFLTSTSTTYSDTNNKPSITISYDNNYNNNTYNRITSVSKYSDNSIGSLRIEKINLSQRIFESVDLDVLEKGIGHFSETSMWDGNVSLAAHNRGSAPYFADIDKLVNGDVVEYTTKQGTRKYKVFSVKKINETDTSDLLDTYDNTITLITCVRNDRDYRWCVKASEIN